jgi:alkaline phosphatase
MLESIKKGLVGLSFLLGMLIPLFPIQAEGVEGKTPKNIIYMIGDGMGIAHVTLTRIINGPLNMDRFSYGGAVITYSANDLITDSAAAGTALATGYKTNNGMISQNPKGEKLKTALEVAKENGKATGIVTTTRITHATPAVFYAHIGDRDEEDRIAEQLANAGVDVIFGGGESYFLPSYAEGSKRKDNLNLINRLKNIGYEVPEDRNGLLKVSDTHVAGLFSPSHMSYELDRHENEPTIAEMTQKAIELLSKNDDGFFLMVEGGRIDHAAHANDAAGVVAETLAFDKALGVALDFAKSNLNTLVVVTADHSTGGLTLGKGIKQWYNPDILKNADISFENFVPLLMDGGNTRELFANHYGITDLTDNELKKIGEVLKAGGTEAIEATLGEVIAARTNIVFTTINHDGSAVPLFTYGLGAFGGFLDNTEVGEKINELLLTKKSASLPKSRKISAQRLFPLRSDTHETPIGRATLRGSVESF